MDHLNRILNGVLLRSPDQQSDQQVTCNERSNERPNEYPLISFYEYSASRTGQINHWLLIKEAWDLLYSSSFGLLEVQHPDYSNGSMASVSQRPHPSVSISENRRSASCVCRSATVWAVFSPSACQQLPIVESVFNKDSLVKILYGLIGIWGWPTWKRFRLSPSFSWAWL